MTSLQRFESVFEGKVITELPMAICYESILIRDHFDEISDMPWEYFTDSDMEKRLLWHKGIKKILSHDWVEFPFVYCIDDDTKPQKKPVAGGNDYMDALIKNKKEIIDSNEQIDRLIPILEDDGALPVGQLTERLKALYSDRPIKTWVLTPFWQCNRLWDFEDLMTLTLDAPGIVAYAAQRYLRKTIKRLEFMKKQGVRLIWVEECYTDMLSPRLFESLNIVYAKEVINAIRSLGMKSVYYYTGNPYMKLEMLLSTGADAYAFEEGKKGFDIDVIELAKRIKGESVLVGNLDSIGVLQDGTMNEIRQEVKRQVAAGKINDGRFIVGIGSPVTPLTPMAKIIELIKITREEAVI